LPAGKEYALTVDQLGYLFYSAHFDLTQDKTYKDPLKLDVPLTKINVGEKVVLNNIFFETDSYKLLPQSNAELAKIRNFLYANPLLKLEVGGHTDNTGTPEYNKDLSEKRAKAVYDYLNRNGDFNDRLSYKGYGEAEPVAPNSTPEGQALNRRTELKVVGRVNDK
jgi:outer membrane protein OmpA-like peptidoglycan-associated protein